MAQLLSPEGSGLHSKQAFTTQTPQIATGSDHSDDDMLALLPKHTVVRIVGNNRTKSALIGQTGVVRRAVGLGGWHWLVLDSGEECKIQRNALCVTEYPSGNEPESTSEEEGVQQMPVDSYPELRRRSDEQHSRARPPARKIEHTSRRAAVRPAGLPGRVNLHRMSMGGLQRYMKAFHLPSAGPHPTRDQLMAIVGPHFSSTCVDEDHVISKFLAAVGRSQGGGASRLTRV